MPPHREHPLFHYGEPILLVALMIVGAAWAAWMFVRPTPPPPASAPATPPTIEVVEGEEVVNIGLLQWKTGRKEYFRRVLPYEGAPPETATYEPVRGHDRSAER